MQGLSVSRVVDVQVNFAPIAAPLSRFDTLLIMGTSGVVDTGEAVREYNSIDEVAGDFGTATPEYQAAALFFSQIPTPTTLFIGQWAKTATKGRLTGGPVPNAEQIITLWNTVYLDAALARLREEMEKRQLLMKMRLMQRELQG
jgi:hypothetical protein